MSNNSFYRTLVEGFDRAAMRHAATRAYTALFEAGLSPQKKTRRAIRAIIQAPPNGWDAPALDTEGEEILSADHQNRMTNAQCLEFTIRNNFFHDGGRSNPKFEPGVARIAYAELGMWPENLGDWRSNKPAPDREKLRKLGMLVRAISGAHSDEYDFDLNGMGFNELESRFATSSVSEKAVNEEADGSGCRYNVTWIKNFTEATEWAKYTEDTQTWCLTEYRNYWNTYTKGNTVKMYFCTVPGFEDVKPVAGENAPLDEYGLSLLGVGINPDGTLNCCCTRWNHLHGGTDLALDEAQLCKLFNVRELSDVCPPFTEEDRQAQTAKMDDILASVKASLAGENVPLEYLAKMDQVSIVRVALKSNPSRYYVVAIKRDGTPAVKYPLALDYFKVFGNYCVVAAYDPYMEGISSDDDSDQDSLPHVLIRHDGETWDFKETTGDEDYNDVLDQDDDNPDINHGRVLYASAPFEDDVLMDVTRFKFPADYISVTRLSGNMFIAGTVLYLVTKDSLVTVLEDYGYEQDYSVVGYQLMILHPDDEASGQNVFSIYDTVTGKELLRKEEIDDVSYLFQQVVELDYDDGTSELIDSDGHVLRERMDVPSKFEAIPLFNLVQPPFAQLNTTLLPGNNVLYAKYDLRTNRYNGVSCRKLPADITDMSSTVIFMTEKGAALLCHETADSPNIVITADGHRIPGGYTYKSKQHGHPFLLYRKDSEGVPVNMLSRVNGAPVFTPEMEKLFMYHLKAVYSVGSIGEVVFALDETVGELPLLISVDAVTCAPQQMSADEIRKFFDFHTYKSTEWNRDYLMNVPRNRDT